MRIEWDLDGVRALDDLCGKFAGKFVDIVRNESDGTWSCLFNGERITSGHETREKAVRSVEIKRRFEPGFKAAIQIITDCLAVETWGDPNAEQA